jgi:hypothetical protein
MKDRPLVRRMLEDIVQRLAPDNVRAIGGNAESAYLMRYTLAALPDGGFVYLHRFLRGDHDRELHSHPWIADSVILVGGYVEERREGAPGNYRVERRECRAGDVNLIGTGTFHRIDLLEADTWSLIRVGPRTESWGFWCRDTGVFTPWRDFLRAKGLLVEEGT